MSPTTSATRSHCPVSPPGPTPSTIVFCGVHFMAETAKLLSPDKTVLIPTAQAGCSLADTIDADQLRAWKAEHPGAAVVAYVNTTRGGEGGGRRLLHVVQRGGGGATRSPPISRVLFLPDQFLGAHVRRQTGRDNIEVWMGECHVHAGISPVDLRAQVAAESRRGGPGPPECGCASSTHLAGRRGDLPAERTHILSTGRACWRVPAA